MLRSTVAIAVLGGLLSCAPGDPENAGQAAVSAGPEAVVLRKATAEQILDDVRATRSPAVLLNVWATWCVPCREEFPDLMRLREAYAGRGLDLVLVSADFDDQLPETKTFLADNGVDFPTYLKQQGDMAFIDEMNPDWSGALPASFVFGRNGELHFFHEGRATYAMLEDQILEVLAADAASVTEEETP